MECVDLLRHANHDLSIEKTRRSYLERIANKEFAGVLLSTFSRASWANFSGARPIRSYVSVRGLDTVTPAERDRAILCNIFADFREVARQNVPVACYATGGLLPAPC